MKESCGAKTRNGNPCVRAPMPNGRCYHHGGATPVGIAAGNFKHGRYSKFLPARLARRYQEAQADTKLLALREEIALVDARLADLLQRVDTNEAGYWWKELQHLYSDFVEAQAKRDVAAISLRLAEIGQIIVAGSSDYAAWGEVYGVLEQRRKLVESERKRLVEMQQYLTAERAMLLVSALADIVKQNVSDPAALARISADVGRLLDTEQ